MVTGQCNCGAVTFGVNAEVEDVYVCHCSLCRRATGSGGIAVTIVDNAVFGWLKGEDQITHWAKPGHDWHTWFCKVCGSNLPGKNDEHRMYIPVGALTSGHEALTVVHHIWVDSMAAWEVIGDDGKRHPRGFESQ